MKNGSTTPPRHAAAAAQLDTPPALDPASWPRLDLDTGLALDLDAAPLFDLDGAPIFELDAAPLFDLDAGPADLNGNKAPGRAFAGRAANHSTASRNALKSPENRLQ